MSKDYSTLTPQGFVDLTPEERAKVPVSVKLGLLTGEDKTKDEE